MPNEIETAVQNAAARLSAMVEDGATLTVTTKYVEVDQGGSASFDQAKPVAQTVIKADGDTDAIIPMRPGAGGALGIDTTLMALHQQNVQAGIDYRARLVNALLQALRERLG